MLSPRFYRLWVLGYWSDSKRLKDISKCLGDKPGDLNNYRYSGGHQLHHSVQMGYLFVFVVALLITDT